MNSSVVGTYEDPISVVARRRVPRVYVLDTTGDVLLRGAAEGALAPDTRDVVLNLMANHPGEDRALGLSRSGEVVRLARLEGPDSPHYALFLEPFAARSPVELAAERFGLSDRECDVLRCLLRGASTTDIASELFIAHSTVTTHVRNIGLKMNTSKRKEIVAAVLGSR